MAVDLNDIGFAIRVEKLIENINRYREKKDSNKLLEKMFELKMEVERYTGQRIDLDKEIDRVEHDIKKNGGKFKKDEMNNVRKIIKSKEKRVTHKMMYMATCQEYDLPYNAEEEYFMFMAKHSDEK